MMKLIFALLVLTGLYHKVCHVKAPLPPPDPPPPINCDCPAPAEDGLVYFGRCNVMCPGVNGPGKCTNPRNGDLCTPGNDMDEIACTRSCQKRNLAPPQDNDGPFDPNWSGYCNADKLCVCYNEPYCNDYCRSCSDWERGQCLDVNEDGDFECVCDVPETDACCIGDPGYTTSGGLHFISHVLFKHVLLQRKKEAKGIGGSKCQGTAAKLPKFTLYMNNECGMWINGKCDFANPWVVELKIFGQTFNFTFHGRHVEDDFFVTVSRNGGPETRELVYYGKKRQYISFHPIDSAMTQYEMRTNFGLRFTWKNSKTFTSTFTTATATFANNRLFYVHVPRVPAFQNSLEGVLGVFSNETAPENHLRLPDGTIFKGTNYDQYIQNWHAKGKRRGRKRKGQAKKKCKPKVARLAEKFCTGLLHPDSSPFKDCFKPPYRPTWVNDVAEKYGEARVSNYMNHWYWQSYMFETDLRRRAEANRLQCVNDVCLMKKHKDPLANGACGFVEDFVTYCRNMKTGVKGFKLPEWRTNDFCLNPNPCPYSDMVYTDCLGCPRLCAKGKKAKKCTKPDSCQPGCQCKKGLVLDMKSGKCMKKNKCPK